MAKRFTDTGKWSKASFGEMPSKMKLAWIYLCDNCDQAGIWDINIGLLSYQVGEQVTISEIKETFGDKVIFVSKTKLFLPSFIEFQYGCSVENLNPDSKIHKSVLKILEKHSLTKGYPKGMGTLKDKYKDKEKDKDKDKDKDKEKVKEKEKGEKTKMVYLYKEALAGFKESLPNTVEGPKACERFKEQIQTENDFQDLTKAVGNYKRALEVQTWRPSKTSFSTFLGTKKSGYFWRDFIDFEATAEPEKQPTVKKQKSFAEIRSEQNAELYRQAEMGAFDEYEN